MFRKSLKEKQAERERFNIFLEDFGIDKNATLHSNSSTYRGNILSVNEILVKFIKHRIIGNSIIGRFIGKLMIYWRGFFLIPGFNDPSSYYASYKFEFIDHDQWRLEWFDRL